MAGLIERMARAMAIAESVDPDLQVFSGQPLVIPGAFAAFGPAQPAWHLYVLRARRALEAALEPTERMVLAGHGHALIAGNPYDPDVAAIWRAMIHAELKES